MFVRKTSGLLKELNSLDVTLLNLSFMGAIAGLNYPLYVAMSIPNASWIIGVLLGALMTLPLVINYYLISTEYSRASADYVFVSRNLNGFSGVLMAISLFVSFVMGFPVLSMLEVIYVIIPGLQSIGFVINNQSLINFGYAILNSPTLLFLLTIFFSSLTFLLSLSVKIYFKTIRYLTFAEIISTGLIIYSLFHYHSSSDPLYHINFTQTVALSQIMILSYFAFVNAPAYFAGEVKKPRKAMFYGYIISWLLNLIISIIIVLSIEFSIGKINYLSIESKGWSFPIIPNSLISFASVSFPYAPIVYVIFITSLSWYMLYALQNFVMSSRLLFSLSFDRILPAFFSDVWKGTPIKALIFSFGLSLIFSWIEVYQGYSISFAIDGVWFILWSYLLVSIASIKKYKIIGILSTISMFFTVFFTLYYGFINSSFGNLIFQGNTTFDIFTIILPPITAIIIYSIVKKYREREGIDISKIFKEIPPE
ncbi:hypothetical protein SJAV_01010 [Sulfurisphaera javensis]|uniref:Amino acid permease n=1 Tax=Sulfurisphaera javensis TaxID=2049879 RepID=A0AAT9GMV8_9CREN